MRWLVLFALAPALFACGSTLDCEVKGDNVEGRINFDGPITVEGDRSVIIQYSENNFASVKRTDAVWNSQGLLTLPFSLCADVGMDFQVRAFQDSNGNGSWDPGEGVGRDDGTSDGHGAYITRNVPEGATDTSGAISTSTWNVQRGVDITLDESGSL